MEHRLQDGRPRREDKQGESKGESKNESKGGI